MNSGPIRHDMEAFQASVRRLSGEIGRASALWQDEKFSQLSASVSTIASMSRDLIIAGDACCASIDRFAQIASEQY